MHLANIHQNEHSIRNMQVVSSNRVYSTHLCEANICIGFQWIGPVSDQSVRNFELIIFFQAKMKNAQNGWKCKIST